MIRKNKPSQFIAVRKIFDKERKEEGELFLKGLRKKGTETLEEFIRAFFTKYNNEKATYIFKKDKSDELFCDVGRRRSLQDLYKICKYYYPDCKLREIKEILNYWMQEKTLRCTFCSQVLKEVYFTCSPENFKVRTKEESNQDETGLWVNEITEHNE